MDIVHDAAASRFQLDVDGQRCVLEYALLGSVMTITHTGVPSALEGRGLAARLTQAAFDHARAHGWKVRPACSYAAAWVRRHPEVADLVV